jgi:hypothetical protein
MRSARLRQRLALPNQQILALSRFQLEFLRSGGEDRNREGVTALTRSSLVVGIDIQNLTPTLYPLLSTLY